MDIDRDTERRGVSRRGIYFSSLALCAGLGAFALTLAVHRSVEPSFLGRYSVRFALLLGSVVVLFALCSTFVAVCWPRLPDTFASLFRRRDRAGLASALVASGFVMVAGALVFRPLISLFVAANALVASIALSYAGFVGLILNSVSTSQRRVLRRNVLLILAGTSIGLVVGELGLRITDQGTPYRILPSNMQRAFRTGPGLLPGVSGPSQFTTNAAGIRGDPMPTEDLYTILTIGGSTTECAYLDDTETWSHLLQEKLSSQRSAFPAWVGNVGRSGHGLVEHIHAVRYFVPQFEIDAIIVVSGINDAAPAWWDPQKYKAEDEDPDNLSQFLHKSFFQRPLVDARMNRSFPESTALWNAMENAFWYVDRRFDDLVVEDKAGINYQRRRQQFLSASFVVDDLPDLSAAVDRYEENLRTLVGAAREVGVRLILSTQPAMWSDQLSETGMTLLWFGILGSPDDARYSVRILRQMLTQFNDRMLRVCRDTGTECVDLAGEMDGDERYFYDDVHFNELGAETVANILAAHFAAHFAASGGAQR